MIGSNERARARAESSVEMPSGELRELCKAVVRNVPAMREARKRRLIDEHRPSLERVGLLGRLLGMRKKTLSDDDVWYDLNANRFVGEETFLRMYGDAEQIANRMLVACRYSQRVFVSAPDLETLDAWAGLRTSRDPYRS